MFFLRSSLVNYLSAFFWTTDVRVNKYTALKPEPLNPWTKSGPGNAGSLQVPRTLINERYRFFNRGDYEPVCLVSKIDI
jgi:hypothetical protein